MRRKLLNLATAISLILCTAAVAVWVRSYWVSDHVLFADVQGKTVPVAWSHVGMHVLRGGFTFGAGGETSLTPAVASELQSRVGRGWRPLRCDSGPAMDISEFVPVNWSGFGYFVVGPGPPFRAWRYQRAVSIPMWVLVVMFGLAPTVWLMRTIAAKKRFRIARGLCPACGYDLRATPGRCPECGPELQCRSGRLTSDGSARCDFCLHTIGLIAIFTVGCSAPVAKPAADWPPPLDREAVVGMWMRPNGGPNEHLVLWLLPNGDWVRAAAVGPESAITKVEHVERGSPWSVRNSAGPLFYGPQLVVGQHSNAISHVSRKQLVLGPRMESIVSVDDYHRVAGETAKHLETLLEVDD